MFVQREGCSDCGAAPGVPCVIGCVWDESGADVPAEELEDLEGASFFGFTGGLVQEARDAA